MTSDFAAGGEQHAYHSSRQCFRASAELPTLEKACFAIPNRPSEKGRQIPRPSLLFTEGDVKKATLHHPQRWRPWESQGLTENMRED